MMVLKNNLHNGIFAYRQKLNLSDLTRIRLDFEKGSFKQKWLELRHDGWLIRMHFLFFFNRHMDLPWQEFTPF